MPRVSFRSTIRGLDRAIPGERQHLARQITAPLGHGVDLVDVDAERIALAEPPLQERAARVDDGEEVVEVVRDAARQAPDRLESLRLLRSVLRPLHVRHVRERPHRRGGGRCPRRHADQVASPAPRAPEFDVHLAAHALERGIVVREVGARIVSPARSSKSSTSRIARMEAFA